MKTHGKTKTPEFKSWQNMKDRCLNKRSSMFHYYGGRGVAVCQRWMKFENFLKDMGARPSNEHSLDRIDNNGNYEPKNCRWATHIEQHNNQRGIKLIKYRGEIKTRSQWARIFRIKVTTFDERLKRGWTLHKSLNHPVRIKA